MRILMVTPYFPPIINGPSLHVYHLVTGLLEHGVNVHVHTMCHDVNEKILPDCDPKYSISFFKPISLFRSASFDQPLSFSYIKSTIDMCDYFDVVHIHDFPKLCNDALVLALKKIKPKNIIIMTPHGAGPITPANKLSSKVYWSSGMPVKILKLADHLITVTHMQKNVFAQVCDEQKISMISEAIPSQYFVDTPSFSDNGKLKVLFIGRMIQEKGVKDLIYAIYLVSKKLKNSVELRCIGPDYGFKQKALEMIKELGLEQTVTLLGPLPEEQKLLNLKWCDVLVLPSYYEAFGIPIIEAMASGKPVIATKTIGAISLVKPNKTGFLVNFNSPTEIADRLSLFQSKPNLKHEMGEYAMNSVRSFSMQNMIKQHVSLYHSLKK